MKPYTDTYQKTMIPIHGKPLLEYIIEGVKTIGIKDFVIVVSYRKEQIIDYFQYGSKWNIRMEYVEQKELNGTGGALLLCEDLIKEKHFFLTWGDILVPYYVYQEAYATFKNENQNFILVTNYQENLQKGCEIHLEGDYLEKMIEKPPKEEQCSNLNNCGIFIFSKDVFEEVKQLTPSQRGELELPDAISKGVREKNWKVRIIKMKPGEFRGDFGDLRVYELLKKDSEWLRKVVAY